MKHVMALDQGTTSSRAILFDSSGRPVATAQREFAQHFPRAGWVEHDPEEIWSSQLDVAREALRSSDLSAGDVAVLGITNQRETTLLWNRETGRPVHNAIVWQDRRTAGLCDRLKADGVEPLFRRKTGLVLDPYFSGTKLAWLLDNVPEARRDAEAGRLAFGNVDAWLLWKLTGGDVHATDVTNASRTLLFDIHTGSWDDELLRALHIPREVLPEVVPSSGVCGSTSVLGGDVSIGGIAGDQQAALFGQGATAPGLAKNTYGTGCFVLMNTGERPVTSANGLLTTTAWKIGAQTHYALEGSVFIAGAAVQWLRDGLGVIRRSSDIEALAASVDGTDGVVFVPAFAGLGAPHWDPYARGALLGLTRGSSAGHVARAVLEGIAQQVADVVEAMTADAGARMKELRVDGGAAANDLLLQLQADLLGLPVARMRMAEATALGAAGLAGLAVGMWKNVDEIASKREAERVFEPAIPADDRARRRAEWARAVEKARGWAAPGA